jgi:hypothetical protein
LSFLTEGLLLLGAGRILENRKIFDRAAKKADSALQKDDLTSAIAWAKIAAHFAFVRHSGIYMSPALEQTMLEVARRIKQQPPDVSGAFYMKNKPRNMGKMRFLHVITEGYAAGGHSLFVARWINNTLENSVHSLIATAQKGEIPAMLRGAVDASGGWVVSLTELSPDLVEQALLLRLLAQDWADVIVLFIHPFDPLPLVAFGVSGGPPVVYCNHADHAFWLGASIADAVFDYHWAGSEICQKHRGTGASKILPIPLEKNSVQQPKEDARAELGFKGEAVLLTVGRDEKYYPYDGFDFLAAMTGFLNEHINVKLVAAGPQNTGKWRMASDASGGKIEVLGQIDRSELEKYYLAADVYVPSFPCGSGTALLEAALHNLPIVGLHIDQLPNFSLEDDVGFIKLKVHQPNLDGFVGALEAAISNSHSRLEKALLVKENVEREHCPPGWNSYLNDALQALPSQHRVRTTKAADQALNHIDMYWENISAQMMGNELAEHSYSRLIRVYGKYLSKTDMLGGQAMSLLSASLQVDSFKRSRQFFSSLKESVNSAFVSRVSA